MEEPEVAKGESSTPTNPEMVKVEALSPNPEPAKVEPLSPNPETVKVEASMSPNPETVAAAAVGTPDESAPSSRKRSVSHSTEMSEPPAKRQRVIKSGLGSPPAENYEERITATMDTRAAFDDEISHLLRRSIAVVLEHVGFHGASKQALEAISGEVDSC
jgi:hypothetical protein